MDSDSNAIGLIVAALALGWGVAALHIWSFRRKSPERRAAYLLVVVSLMVGSLFIPIASGSGHMDTVRLWGPYYLLSTPGYYHSQARDFVIDGAVFVLPLMHHSICILLASLAVGKLHKETIADSFVGNKPPR